MRKLIQLLCLIMFAANIVTVAAQEDELPIHWKGEGEAKFLSRENELNKLSIDVVIDIDGEGYVEGYFSSDEGKATIKKFYYAGMENGVRKIMIVLLAEDADDPFLALMDSRVLNGKFLYGEIFMKAYDKDGEIEKSLRLSDSSATEIYPGYLPTSLKTLQSKAIPYGVFSVLGDKE